MHLEALRVDNVFLVTQRSLLHKKYILFLSVNLVARLSRQMAFFEVKHFHSINLKCMKLIKQHIVKTPKL